jgi:hypothetical protein
MENSFKIFNCELFHIKSPVGENEFLDQTGIEDRRVPLTRIHGTSKQLHCTVVQQQDTTIKQGIVAVQKNISKLGR